ncbi:putative protein TPRXL isoform X3 [Xyrauchen texanus]|uniref:putative protein TPRXL isoform X3 n=1 Tax=Xyrauchen texanus TaxID=154827 RepID=UPI002241BBAA|nr:putative protein TPRXL isoform X3 [Xyrauchen texanus]
MVSGDVFSTFRKSKTLRSCIKVFLFSILLQMSLLSNVLGDTSDNTTTSYSSILTSILVQTSTSPTMGPDSSSTSTITGQATPASEITDTSMTSEASSYTLNTSPNPSPNISPNPSLNTSPNPSLNPSLNTSPNTSPNPSLNTSPNPSLNTSPNPSSNTSPNPSSNTSPNSNTPTVPSDSTSMITASSNSSLMGNDTVLSCPEFTCTTNCYTQFMNEMANLCPSNAYSCELTKQDTSYSVNCSASCGLSCGNATLNNCSVDCCNTTNCLNTTLFAMTNSATTTGTTTQATTTTTTIKVTVATTQANNGKKCHNFTCNGVSCFTGFTNTIMMCPITQDYCMLKKTTSTNGETWQGSCSTDCRLQQPCTASVIPCYLECCNASTTNSCLKLSGQLNMPSSATRGTHSSELLMASLLLLLILRGLI